jgi:hypothetical protein
MRRWKEQCSMQVAIHSSYNALSEDNTCPLKDVMDDGASFF